MVDINLEEIRKMPDEELVRYLNTISIRKNDFCIRCGKPVTYYNRITINKGLYSPTSGQKMKKICSMCTECYPDLLDYLGISDVG